MLSSTKDVWGNQNSVGLTQGELSNMDPFAKQQLKKLFSQRPSANLMKIYHLVFNNLLWAARDYGSKLAEEDSTIMLQMAQYPDTFDQERRSIRGLYNESTDPTRNNFKLDEDSKDALIMSHLNQLGIQFTEPQWVDGNSKEDILKLLDHDRILNNFRYSTVNKLFRQSLGSLFLDFNNPLRQFPGDNIFWNSEWFSHIFQVYGENNRQMLSTEKQNFLILRTVLQDLMQTRSLRLELASMSDSVNTLENKLDNMERGNTRANSNLLQKLDSIDNLMQTIDQPSTSGFTELELEDTELDNSLHTIPEQICPNLTIPPSFLNLLKKCSTPAPQRPDPVLSSLHTRYLQMEKTVKKLQEMIREIDEDDGLMQSLNLFSNEVTMNLHNIGEELSSFQMEFNETISFFQTLNEKVTYVKNIYLEYNLHIIWWVLVCGLGILVTLKIFSLIINCVKAYPLISNYISDWHTFRELRNQQRRVADNPQEAAYPLVRRN